MKKLQTIIGLGILSASLTISSGAIAQGFWFPSASFFSPSAASWESDDEMGVFQALKQQSDHQTLSRYLSSDIVNNIQGKYTTVLAPTDEAFARLPISIQVKLKDSAYLDRLLKYHLVLGEITEEDIRRRAVATMLEQTSVTIAGLKVNDEVQVKLNEAKAQQPKGFVDGVIIPIDTVLIPPGF